MYRLILKRAVLVLGIASALACIGLGIYVFKNPAADHAQFLLQLAMFLIMASILSNIVLSQWKKTARMKKVHSLGWKKEKLWNEK